MTILWTRPALIVSGVIPPLRLSSSPVILFGARGGLRSIIINTNNSGASATIRKSFSTRAAGTLSSSSEPILRLRERYFSRLGFLLSDQGGTNNNLSPPPPSIDTPNLTNLNKLIEAHLDKITFDNLSQHGLPHTACLDVQKTATKVLDEGRGGFCFELNGLFAELLLDLGYGVKRIPAFVNTNRSSRTDGGEFRTSSSIPTHIILVVSIPPLNPNAKSINANGHDDDDDDCEYFVDVGFGEPPINALRYKCNIEQSTPEGMVSRLIRCPDDPDSVMLQWKKWHDDDVEGLSSSSSWLSRLRWRWDHPGQDLSCFQENLDAVLRSCDNNIFHQKLIVCKINRSEKLSLAGTRFKTTSPRFGPHHSTVSVSKELGCCEEAVQKVLVERFNVPKHNAKMLNLTKSIGAKPDVWNHL